MRTIFVRSIILTSLTAALGLAGCEKQPTTAPTDGDAPTAEDPTAADSAGEEPPADAPKEGGW